MKLTTSILALMMAGGAWAQAPNVIQSTQDKLNAVQQQKTADSNAALAVAEGQTAKPTPSVPASGATAAKPASSKPAASKPAAAQPASAKPAVVNASAGKPAVDSKAAPASKPAASSSAAPASKPAASSSAAPASKPAASTAAAPKTVAVPAVAATGKAVAATAAPAAKAEAKKPAAKSVTVIVPKAAKPDKKANSVVKAPSPAPAKPEEKEKKYAMTGKRDPFISPVVSHVGGSGCSSGKKCLEIGQINLKGVVKADTGMIAVVTNSMNKAYFLRENDPVFNGYVEKITGDSITFKETFQDKLGKSLTRDVVKKILTPAV